MSCSRSPIKDLYYEYKNHTPMVHKTTFTNYYFTLGSRLRGKSHLRSLIEKLETIEQTKSAKHNRITSVIFAPTLFNCKRNAWLAAI